MDMKYKLISILTFYDLDIIDAIEINEVMDDCLYITTETRERIMDVMRILQKYDEDESEEFLNNVRITLDARRNQIEFINVTHEV